MASDAKTSDAVGGKVVGLYVSSREIENELRRRNMTSGLLSSHLAAVRARVMDKPDQPFEIVYVPLDVDAKSYRDVVRASCWPAMILRCE